MTTETVSRNPAAMKLQDLARCRRIEVFQAGDEDVLCAHDLIHIERSESGWRHDPAEIRRLREMTHDGQWPE